MDAFPTRSIVAERRRQRGQEFPLIFQGNGTIASDCAAIRLAIRGEMEFKQAVEYYAMQATNDWLASQGFAFQSNGEFLDSLQWLTQGRVEFWHTYPFQSLSLRGSARFQAFV